MLNKEVFIQLEGVLLREFREKFKLFKSLTNNCLRIIKNNHQVYHDNIILRREQKINGL